MKIKYNNLVKLGKLFNVETGGKLIHLFKLKLELEFQEFSLII